MIKECIRELIKGNDLDRNSVGGAVKEIMEGKAGAASTGAFLALLSAKGETVDEISAAAMVMRDKAENISAEGELFDTCSTGGTGINHFNISTAAAFVISGCGVKVAKHGNRALSGRCGSADVLENLGVDIQMPPEKVAACIRENGIGFLFAPLFHRAMKNAAGPRKELGIRTVFNILGPLTNPAGVQRQLLGVFNRDLIKVMAGVLSQLGVKRAMVVHGSGGLDEISLSGPSFVAELKEGEISEYEIEPSDLGLPYRDISELRGSGAGGNAARMKKLFKGEKGAVRDAVLASSAAALVVAEKAKNLKEGVSMAAESIDSGGAYRKLEKLVRFS